jgi:hypothetical protein
MGAELMDIKLQFTNIKIHYPLSIASQNRQTKKKHDHAPCGTRALNRSQEANSMRSGNGIITFRFFSEVFAAQEFIFLWLFLTVVVWRHR